MTIIIINSGHDADNGDDDGLNAELFATFVLCFSSGLNFEPVNIYSLINKHSALLYMGFIPIRQVTMQTEIVRVTRNVTCRSQTHCQSQSSQKTQQTNNTAIIRSWDMAC